MINPELMKTCTKCKRSLSLDCFSNDKAKRDGKYSTCKQCKKEYDKKYKQQNKNHIKEHSKKYYQQNKERIKEGVKKWREQSSEHLKQYNDQNKEHIKAYKRKWGNKNREECTDFYIKRLLVYKSALTRKDIPPEMVQAKREEIKIKRLLKEMNK